MAGIRPKQVKFDDMVRLDLRYATSWSLWLDFKILALTPLAVLRGTGLLSPALLSVFRFRPGLYPRNSMQVSCIPQYHFQSSTVVKKGSDPVNFGVIGYGYWGPNIVRNLMTSGGFRGACNRGSQPSARNRAQKAYPGIQVTADAGELLSSTEIDAIAVISPVWTHYELTKAALENGKHVFVEKPFTSNAAQGEELIELAAKKNLKIMVDHTFLFTGAVQKIRQLLDEGTLGKLYYYDSMRVNLGLFQHDINVLWDLAPHDLSIMDYLIKSTPRLSSQRDRST
jgi:hypothetical protein